jgi:hypothetical protein
MKNKIYNLGNDPIMFGDKAHCIHCKHQDELLKKKFNSGSYLYKQVTPGTRLKNGMVINAIPTWYIPKANGQGVLKEGIIKTNLKSLLQRKRTRFGNDDIPEIGTLAKYGKNFSNGEGFQTGNSWENQVTKTWGDPTLSGTLGREFGPGNTDQIYSNGYFNNIRMAYPGGDLDTTLNLNRSCNKYNPTPDKAYPVNYSAGMIYDSPNPQISSFGKRKKRTRFGNYNLNQQMGPVPSQKYLLKPDTFNNLYAGGGQGGPVRPNKGSNEAYYINQASAYYPIKSVTSFGNSRKKLHKKLKKLLKPKKKVVRFVKPDQVKQKKQKKKVGEGSVISINKFGKIVFT